jgi:cephalosporin-C deacetylase-like acetyl esterase
MTTLLVAASVSLLLQARPDLGPPAPDLLVNAAPAVTVRQLTYAQLDGSRNAATLVEPAARIVAPRAAILYLHWYGPPHPSSNRTQFLPEAVDLAGDGVVSLLVDTPWSRERWFGQRDSAKDYEFTVQMAKDVRRALDVLLAQPRIDPTRVAVVGHDFGAMWGALAVAADPRVTHFVYAAGTPSFTDWYLYTPKREGAEREAFVAKLAPLDPINFLPKIAPRPVLLQFGSKDPHVKNEAAKAQAEATKDPKTVKIYDNAEHELTFQARLDRLAWIKEQFKIK